MVGSIILKTKIAEMVLVLNLVMILVTGEWRSWCQEQGTTLFAGSSADKVFNKLSKKNSVHMGIARLAICAQTGLALCGTF